MVTVAACSSPPGNGLDRPRNQCSFTSASGNPDVRDVAIGTASGYRDDAGSVLSYTDRFALWSDGGDAELVGGAQGGYMVQPMLRLSAGSSTGDRECFSVRVRNRVATANHDDVYTISMEFYREGMFYYTDPFNNLLGFERESFDGQELILRVDVTGSDFASGVERGLTLLSR